MYQYPDRNDLPDAHQLADQFSRALDNEEFELHYQPQFDLTDSLVVGLEALIRWRHPRFGILSPAVFIAGLEDSPQACRVGTWVIERALCDLARINSAPNRKTPLRMAINLFQRQFVSERLAGSILDAIVNHCCTPELVEFEITERMAMENAPGIVRTVLNQLDKAGCIISLDDFGTGFASLSSIANFPINKLKIDRQFVERLDLDRRHTAIVKAILHLAETLDLSVTAEGIENLCQMQALRDLGCREGQGFLFARAMSIDALEPWLLREHATSIVGERG